MASEIEDSKEDILEDSELLIVPDKSSLKQYDKEIDKPEETTKFITNPAKDSNNRLNLVKKYSCDQCNYISHSYFIMSYHVQSIHEIKKFLCDRCDFNTNAPYDLKRHWGRRHKEFNISCKLCRTFDKLNVNTFKSFIDFKRHVIKVHKALHFTCNICHFITSSPSYKELIKHKELGCNEVKEEQVVEESINEILEDLEDNEVTKSEDLAEHDEEDITRQIRRKDSETEYFCNYCVERVVGEKGLGDHLALEHGDKQAAVGSFLTRLGCTSRLI